LTQAADPWPSPDAYPTGSAAGKVRAAAIDSEKLNSRSPQQGWYEEPQQFRARIGLIGTQRIPTKSNKA
jgi:hypothetical protein